jgi:hypothetical protein
MFIALELPLYHLMFDSDEPPLGVCFVYSFSGVGQRTPLPAQCQTHRRAHGRV